MNSGCETLLRCLEVVGSFDITDKAVKDKLEALNKEGHISSGIQALGVEKCKSITKATVKNFRDFVLSAQSVNAFLDHCGEYFSTLPEQYQTAEHAQYLITSDNGARVYS